jgi:hypothetical protein
VAVAKDDIAMNFGYGRFRTDGFDVDRGLAQDSGNVFAQVRASDRLHLQLEMSAMDADYGFVRFGFDPTFAVSSQVNDMSSRLRLGARYEISPQSTVLFSGAVQSYRQSITTFGSTEHFQADAANGEAQYGFTSPYLGITLGGGHLAGKTDTEGVGVQDLSHDNAYVYGRVSDPLQRVGIHLGVAYLNQEFSGAHLESSDPKLGLVVRPRPGTTLRLALFKSTQRQLIANQTLEPTQFAGFNQLWDDPTGASATQYGIGFDQRVGIHTYIGGEILNRDIDVPVLSTPVSLTWRETAGRAYLYTAVPAGILPGILNRYSFALSVQFLYQDVDRSRDPPVDGIVKIRTQQLPIILTAFYNDSISMSVSATYVKREGVLEVFPGFDQFNPGAEFWSFGAAVTYLLPRRHGKLSIGVSNASDQRYSIVDFDPAPLGVPPKQVAYARFSLSF